jgi:hypothetical protein
MTVGRPESRAAFSAAPRSPGDSTRTPSAPMALAMAAKSQWYGWPEAA